MKGLNSSDSSKDYRNETCKSTNWLFDTGNMFWAVSPSSSSSSNAMFLSSNGNVYYSRVSISAGGLRPTIYLSLDVNYISGDGTLSDPFIIK